MEGLGELSIFYIFLPPFSFLFKFVCAVLCACIDVEVDGWYIYISVDAYQGP